MKITIDHNIPAVQAALAQSAKQVPFAMSKALNKTAEEGRVMVQDAMKSVFDRPTPWVLNSLRIKYATKRNLVAELAFKDIDSARSSRTMVEPHVEGGGRHFKVFEARLKAAGHVPKGWNIVPGKAATLDQFGNMSQSQIKQVLSLLVTNGPMPASWHKNRSRLAAGNVKQNQYGFEYFVNPVGGRNKKLEPGIYKRFSTGFGSSLKPILIFVKPAAYKKNLDFFGVVQKKTNERLESNFEAAFKEAMATARP